MKEVSKAQTLRDEGAILTVLEDGKAKSFDQICLQAGENLRFALDNLVTRGEVERNNEGFYLPTQKVRPKNGIYWLNKDRWILIRYQNRIAKILRQGTGKPPEQYVDRGPVPKDQRWLKSIIWRHETQTERG